MVNIYWLGGGFFHLIGSFVLTVNEYKGKWLKREEP